LQKVYSATDIGKKRHDNQDFLFASTDPVGNLPNLFVVADGMGGHNAGDFASNYAVSVMLETIRKDDNYNPIKIIRNGITNANAEVWKASMENPSMAGMGTTLVAASIVGEYLYVANVGDSRLYITGEELRQVTLDHSLIGEMIRLGEINEEEASNHPDKNIITRAVGTEESLEIDFFDIKLEDGQRFLLCTDGLTNMVENGDILETINSAVSEGKNPADALVNKANENGGRDNISVVVVEPWDNEVE
jgi:protein phosphatase